MAFFHSSERRQASIFLDETIISTEAMLEDPSIAGSYKDMDMLLNRLSPVFPDKHGFVEPTKDIIADARLIPLFTYKQGDKLTFSNKFNQLGPTQLGRLKQKFASWEIGIDGLSAAQKALKDATPLIVATTASQAGFTGCASTTINIPSPNIGKKNHRRIVGMPLIGIVETPNVNTNLTLIHEQIHARQFILEPVVSPYRQDQEREKNSKELETYVTTGELAISLFTQSQDLRFRGNVELLENNAHIATIWNDEAHAKADPKKIWHAQGRVIKAIQDIGIKII